MDLIVTFIGFSQSFFAIFLMLNKNPLKIADKIFAVLLAVFALMFGLDILQNLHIIQANRTGISLSLNMLFAPLLYLYSKYITIDYKVFNKIDFLNALPSLVILIILVVLKTLPENNLVPFLSLFGKYEWIKITSGIIFQILLIIYTISALKIVIRFKKNAHQYYSYNSYKISLNWLIAMIVFFFMIILMIIMSSVVYEKNHFNTDAILVRHIVELFYVYVLSIWGFNQKQLNSEIKINSENKYESESIDTALGKYQKSGLKSDDAKNYIFILLKCMEESEVWKDTELSIGKLSIHTSIPKHYLSEVLNEYLGKSFYSFVNEYRIEYAKKLLKSEKYNNWSIVAIAFECGFNSKAAFNNFFKKYTNLTPSEFKKTAN